MKVPQRGQANLGAQNTDRGNSKVKKVVLVGNLDFYSKYNRKPLKTSKKGMVQCDLCSHRITLISCVKDGLYNSQEWQY